MNCLEQTAFLADWNIEQNGWLDEPIKCMQRCLHPMRCISSTTQIVPGGGIIHLGFTAHSNSAQILNLKQPKSASSEPGSVWPNFYRLVSRTNRNGANKNLLHLPRDFYSFVSIYIVSLVISFKCKQAGLDNEEFSLFLYFARKLTLGSCTSWKQACLLDITH